MVEMQTKPGAKFNQSLAVVSTLLYSPRLEAARSLVTQTRSGFLTVISWGTWGCSTMSGEGSTKHPRR